MVSLKDTQKSAIDVTGRLISLGDKIIALTPRQMEALTLARQGKTFVAPLADKMSGYTKKPPRFENYELTGPITVFDKKGVMTQDRVRSDSVNVLLSIGALQKVETRGKKAGHTCHLEIADIDIVEFG